MPILCLDPSQPATTCLETGNFGVPKGTHGRGINSIQGLLIHCLPSNLEQMDAAACKNLRLKAGSGELMSLHWFVGQNGSIHEYVCPADVAWGFPDQLAIAMPDLSAWNWALVTANPNTAVDKYILEIGIDEGIFTHFCDDDDCPSFIDVPGYQSLVQLIAWLAFTYNIPISSNNIQFHQNVDGDAENECQCPDIANLLYYVSTYCERPEYLDDPHYQLVNLTNPLQFVYGIDKYGALSKMSVVDFKAYLATLP